VTTHRKPIARTSPAHIAILVALVLTVAIAAFLRQEASPGSEHPLDRAAIESTSGLSGAFDSTRSVFSYSMSRTHLPVSIDHTPISPAFGLDAWATISGTAREAVLIGDLPLLESEVNEGLRRALELGLTVTALHNRFIGDSPRIMSLHFSFIGDQDMAAKALGQLFTAMNSGELAQRKPALKLTASGQTPLTREFMDGQHFQGEMKNGVYRVNLAFSTRIGDEMLSGPMGVESWAAFTGTQERALVNGEVAVIEPELREALQILIRNEFQITSIHEHFIQEVPKLVFVHFMASGPAQSLASTVHKTVEAHDTHISK